MPPECTRTSSRRRSSSMRRKSASATMLRLVFAWQTISTRRVVTPRGLRSPGSALAVGSDPTGEDVGHRLLLRPTLRELGLELLPEIRGIPHRVLLHLRGRVPALHRPDRPAADAEDLTVDVRGVVAREPGDERRDVARIEDVELALGDF